MKTAFCSPVTPAQKQWGEKQGFFITDVLLDTANIPIPGGNEAAHSSYSESTRY